MTFPEWTKPAVYGAIVGAIAISIVGFNWGGWTTGGSAAKMAKDLARSEVTSALVPICVQMSADDPQRATKIATINKATSYKRRDAVMDTGWATVAGSDTPDRDLAKACMEDLGLDAT